MERAPKEPIRAVDRKLKSWLEGGRVAVTPMEERVRRYLRRKPFGKRKGSGRAGLGDWKRGR